MSRRIDRKATSFPGVQRVGKGTYRIRGKYIHPKTDRRCELDRIVDAPSAREAAHERARLLREAAMDVTTVEMTMRAYARSWYAGKLPKLKASTRVAYATAIDGHILPHFGDWYVDRIAHADVVDWRDVQQGSPVTINGRLRVLKTMMADAKHILGLPLDPAERVESLKTGPKKNKTLTAAELRRLLDAVKRNHAQWYPIILVMAHTGARFGEASALEWRDIDWDAKSLRIERAHTRGAVDTTKTDDPRVVPLTGEMEEVLRAHRIASGGFDLVFPARVAKRSEARNKGYSQPSAVRKPLAVACKAAGIPKRVSSHWFRHTFNNFLRMTADKETQKSLTGHSTDEMAEHYSHVSFGEKQAAVARVLEYVRKGGE